MKILEINKFYYPKGGSEKHLFELEELFKKNGHEVISFSMEDERNFSSKYSKYFIEKVDLDRFSIKTILKFFWNYEAVNKLEKLIKEEEPDVAHLHNIAHQMSPAIIHTLNRHNIPVVQTLHDYKLICPNYQLFTNGKTCYKCSGGKYYNCVLNKCVKNSRLKSLMATLEAYIHNSFLRSYKGVDKFIAPSQFMKDVCVKFGIKEEKIETLYNFIDASSEKCIRGDYFLYFGRISQEKGLDVLFKVFEDERLRDVKLKLVGTGPDFDKWSQRVKEKSLNNIELLGYKSGDDLENLMKNSKAVLLPSLWQENMPYSMLEAMAFGKIVIASDTGGMKEVVENKKNGFLFKSGNNNELLKIIMNFDKYNIDEMEQRSRHKMTNFSSEAYYHKINKILRSLV